MSLTARQRVLMPYLVCGCLSIATMPPSTQGKPVKQSYIYGEFQGPPDSLTEMVLKVDAVVRVRVVAAVPHDPDPHDTNPPRVITAFTCRVLEILHAFGGHSVDPNRLQVLLIGGDRDRGAYVERVIHSGFPLLETGHEYLLFLLWDEAFIGGWTPSFGPNGVFDITTGVVDTPGTRKVATDQKGKKAEDFVLIVRRFGRSAK